MLCSVFAEPMCGRDFIGWIDHRQNSVHTARRVKLPQHCVRTMLSLTAHMSHLGRALQVCNHPYLLLEAGSPLLAPASAASRQPLRPLSPAVKPEPRPPSPVAAKPDPEPAPPGAPATGTSHVPAAAAQAEPQQASPAAARAESVPQLPPGAPPAPGLQPAAAAGRPGAAEGAAAPESSTAAFEAAADALPAARRRTQAAEVSPLQGVLRGASAATLGGHPGPESMAPGGAGMDAGQQLQHTAPNQPGLEAQASQAADRASPPGRSQQQLDPPPKAHGPGQPFPTAGAAAGNASKAGDASERASPPAAAPSSGQQQRQQLRAPDQIHRQAHQRQPGSGEAERAPPPAADAGAALRAPRPPSQQTWEQQQLVRASGKLAFLAHALPKLRAGGEMPDTSLRCAVSKTCRCTAACHIDCGVDAA